jgi:hypothetical protein
MLQDSDSDSEDDTYHGTVQSKFHPPKGKVEKTSFPPIDNIQSKNSAVVNNRLEADLINEFNSEQLLVRDAHSRQDKLLKSRSTIISQKDGSKRNHDKPVTLPVISKNIKSQTNQQEVVRAEPVIGPTASTVGRVVWTPIVNKRIATAMSRDSESRLEGNDPVPHEAHDCVDRLNIDTVLLNELSLKQSPVNIPAPVPTPTSRFIDPSHHIPVAAYTPEGGKMQVTIN